MIWFTADLHFDHANIIGYCNRPFADVADMNDALVDNWNAVVGIHDTVYILGDIAMGKRIDSLVHVRKLQGHKYLVPGNHDYVHPMHGANRVLKWLDAYQDAGLAVLNYRTAITVDGVTLNLNHVPFADSQSAYDARDFQQFATVDDGGFLLHGHVHDTWKVRGKQLNVGVDIWDFSPIDIDMAFDALGIRR